MRQHGAEIIQTRKVWGEAIFGFHFIGCHTSKSFQQFLCESYQNGGCWGNIKGWMHVKKLGDKLLFYGVCIDEVS